MGVFVLRPVLLLSLCIIAGVVLGVLGVPWYALLAGLLLLCMLLYRTTPRVLIAVACLVLALGFIRADSYQPEFMPSGPITTTVQALNTPVATSGINLRGLVRDIETGDRFYMYWTEPWQAGLRLQISGDVVEPAPPQNPGEYDYAARLERQDISGQIFVRHAKFVAQYRTSPLEALRGFLRSNIAILPEAWRGLAEALVLGDKSSLSTTVQDTWRVAGASHILAVSGLHITLAAGSVYLLFRRVAGFRASWAAATGAAVLYAAIVGASPSAWRAALAFALVALAKVTLRESEYLNILAMVAALMLLINPLSVGDAGFTLSFAATAGLIVLAPVFSRLWGGPRYLQNLLATAFAAQAATLPIVLANFGVWPVYGLISNLLVVPLASVLVGSALLVGLVGRLPFIGMLAGYAFSAVAWLSNAIVGLLARLPGASVSLVALPIAAVVVYYTLLLLMTKAKKAQTLLLVTGLLFVIILPSVIPPSGLNITFLSVGNADACHIQLGKQHFLIDTGTAEAAQRIIVPYLRSQGVNNLSAVFISHGHDDHAGGLAVLEEHFGVGHVFVGPGIDIKEGFSFLRNKTSVTSGELRFLASQAQSPLLDLNNQSVVLLLQYGEFSALYAGDIGFPAEAELKDQTTSVSLLKVPHHGSASSSSQQWLDILQPRVAVICVGPNSYGHPASRVLQALTALNAHVLRTDRDGAVKIAVKKSGEYILFTYSQGRWRRVSINPLPTTTTRPAGKQAAQPVPVLWC